MQMLFFFSSSSSFFFCNRILSNHPNIVRLHGVIAEDHHLVVEFMENGSLKDFLESKKSASPTISDLLLICLQVIYIMTYIQLIALIISFHLRFFFFAYHKIKTDMQWNGSFG